MSLLLIQPKPMQGILVDGNIPALHEFLGNDWKVEYKGHFVAQNEQINYDLVFIIGDYLLKNHDGNFEVITAKRLDNFIITDKKQTRFVIKTTEGYVMPFRNKVRFIHDKTHTQTYATKSGAQSVIKERSLADAVIEEF